MSTPKALDSVSRRSFDRRKQGLFKKAYELGKLFDADIAIVVRLNGQHYIYRSADIITWPPSMEDLQSTHTPQNNLPWDFQTKREAYEEAISLQEFQTPPDTPEPPVIHERPRLQARVHKRPYSKPSKPNFRPRFHLPDPPKPPGSLIEAGAASNMVSEDNIWEQDFLSLLSEKIV
ncbi:MAG: hypothetical protein M1839_008591 [Geoglossum umbratile]|nr:MAG: hypothetical protein M1839_008591 [Geoglossum umbratile]